MTLEVWINGELDGFCDCSLASDVVASWGLGDHSGRYAFLYSSQKLSAGRLLRFVVHDACLFGEWSLLLPRQTGAVTTYGSPGSMASRLGSFERYKSFRSLSNDVRMKIALQRYYLSSKAVRSTSIDIILPTYNRAGVLRAAIESVLRQVHQCWHLYICDDGSSDNTADLCSCYVRDSRIHYLPMPHRGVSAARNAGLSRSRSGYVAFLDSDNTWSPEYLSLMLSFLSKQSLDCGFCAALLTGDCDGDKVWLGNFFSWRSCLEVNYIDLNCFVFRRASVGLKRASFDESLRRFVDWDFILAITKESRTAFLCCALVNYYNGDQLDRITSLEYRGARGSDVMDAIRAKHYQLAGMCDNVDAQIACASIDSG
ncbi:glycosyltransferase family 2 protein [Synechococcus sp. RSCCF101]|uniref:glycosyltransferase family 2 protein n=1 Tax=Synechococcus sp. RSCCF101 TaxID=2511069 RepID=UPI001787175B|nr:glycosyltransferase family 2 protein [Synechococcus sp. RSCCF101]